MADHTGHLPRTPGRIFKAAVWSMQGLRAAWLHESSFRLEVYLLVVLTPAALWLGENAIERALMIGSCLLVLSAELLNSAKAERQFFIAIFQKPGNVDISATSPARKLPLS